MKTTELAQTCLLKRQQSKNRWRTFLTFSSMKHREQNSQRYNCTIQMTKCQRLVHMLTVKKAFFVTDWTITSEQRREEEWKRPSWRESWTQQETEVQRRQSNQRDERNKKCWEIKWIAQNIWTHLWLTIIRRDEQLITHPLIMRSRNTRLA